MGDLALVWDPTIGAADLSIDPIADDLLVDEGLQTAILLSLFTDRRAELGDTLPADDGDRRGWWGDQFAEVAGDKIGSRIWLLQRSKLTPSIVPDAEAYGVEALAWLLEDGVTESVDVVAELADVTTDGLVDLLWTITVHRPDGPAEFKFNHIWDAEAAALDG